MVPCRAAVCVCGSGCCVALHCVAKLLCMAALHAVLCCVAGSCWCYHVVAAAFLCLPRTV
eukprot:427026-Alexandrium_andersonii.AAC.1